jgi:type 1 glutamine amidotransferase
MFVAWPFFIGAQMNQRAAQSRTYQLRRWCRIAVCCTLWILFPVVAFAQVTDSKTPIKRKLILLSQGPDGHPATTHEYDAGVKLLAKILAPVPNLTTEVLRADGEWEEGPDKLRQADGVLLYLSQGAKWIHEEPRRLEALAQMAARGGGLSTLHWGMGTKEPQYIDGFVKLFGGCHGGPDRTYKVLETDVAIADETHEIATGLHPFRVHEEFYYRLKFIAAKEALKPILAAEIDGQRETVAWAWERGDGGRSFGFSGCHFHHNWELPEYRRLVAQGLLWTLKIPIPKEGLNVDVTAADLKLP